MPPFPTLDGDCAHTRYSHGNPLGMDWSEPRDHRNDNAHSPALPSRAGDFRD